MGFCTVNMNEVIPSIRFSNPLATYDVKALGFKIESTNDAVRVLAIVSLLKSSDTVKFSKKNDAGGYDDLPSPTDPFPLYFEFHKTEYDAYIDKKWVKTPPSDFEKFITKHLENECPNGDVYSGYFVIAPLREGMLETMQIYDISNPEHQRGSIFREMHARIEKCTDESIITTLNGLEFPASKSGFKKGYTSKSKSEILVESITAINAAITQELAEFATLDLKGLPTDSKLQNACTDVNGTINSELLSLACEARDLLIRLI